MSDLVRAEILKLRTTRTFWAMTLSALALLLVVTVLTLALDPGHDTRDLLSNTGIVGLFALVLGALGMTGEYRHGSVTITFLVSPRRDRVVLAKAVATLVAGAVLGLVAVAVNDAIVLIWRGVAGDTLGVDAGDVIGVSAGAIGFAALSALFGFGVGVILRNQVASIILLLGMLFVIDPLIIGLAADAGKWTPSGLANSLTGGTGIDDVFPGGVAALLYAAYGVLLSLAGSAITARRDVG